MNMYICILDGKVIAKTPAFTKSDANLEFNRLYSKLRNQNFEIFIKGKMVNM